MPKRLCFAVLSVLFLALPACQGKRPPTTMKSEPIFHVSKLVMGILNLGAQFDRSKLDTCPQVFPAMEVLPKAPVHRLLRQAGVSTSDLIAWGDAFDKFEVIEGLQLLLIAFRVKDRDYLRTVNFVGRYVTTVTLDVWAPSCERILLAQRLVVVDSHPPYADVFINRRAIGEAPVWAWLRDGDYEASCKLPGQRFSPIDFHVPQDARLLCRRENVEGKEKVKEGDNDVSVEEGLAAVLLTVLGIAAAAAGILLPLLLL